MNEKPKAPVTAVVQRRDIKDIIDSDGFRKQIAAVLPSHITPDRMARIILTAILKNDNIIQACSTEAGRASLLNSCMVCSQAGLEPDGRLAHLIPFWSKNHNSYLVQVIFDWKGLVALGLRNGMDSIYPDIVYTNDDFDAWLDHEGKHLVHRVNWRKPRGEPYAVYCVSMKDGHMDYEIMTIEETEAIRLRSRAKDSGPWVTDTNEMRKKCAIRRLSKRWDMLPEIRDAINADDDTPPPLNQLPVSEPQFDKGKQLKGRKAPQLPTPAATPEPPPAAESPDDAYQKHKELITDLTDRLKKANVGPGKLLEFLTEIGRIEGDVTDIEMLDSQTLELVLSQFDDICQRL